jgi:hypothetical protein
MLILAIVLSLVPASSLQTPRVLRCVARGKNHHFQVEDEPSPSTGSFFVTHAVFDVAASGSCTGAPDGSYELALTGSGGSCLMAYYDEYGAVGVGCNNWYLRADLRLRNSITGASTLRQQAWSDEVGLGVAFAITQPNRRRSIGAGAWRERGSWRTDCNFTVNFVFTW